ncbi:MAG: hypothetical protein M1388_00980 [Thaumarchaeota archaeon]|nr:hypothetical protein [Nitrososphaerota archaeon]
MPKPGYEVLTFTEEAMEVINEVFEKHKKELRRRGIYSRQQYILYVIRKDSEELGRQMEGGKHEF